MENVTHEPGGLPAAGTEVHMSDLNAQPTVANGNDPIFTRSMSDCIAIAAFDHGNNGERTITHLWDRAAAISFYRDLANRHLGQHHRHRGMRRHRHQILL
jgi:hypothetical protein